MRPVAGRRRWERKNVRKVAPGDFGSRLPPVLNRGLCIVATLGIHLFDSISVLSFRANARAILKKPGAPVCAFLPGQSAPDFLNCPFVSAAFLTVGFRSGPSTQSMMAESVQKVMRKMPYLDDFRSSTNANRRKRNRAARSR